MPTTLISTIHQTSPPKSSSVGWSRAAKRFIEHLRRSSSSATTPPGPVPRSVRTSLPGDLIGSQTTRSGIGGDPHRQGDRAERAAHRQPVAVDDAEPARRPPPRSGRRRAGRCRPARARRRCSVPTSSSCRQEASTASSVAERRRRPRRDVEPDALPEAARGAQRGELGAGRLGHGQPQVDVHLVGQALQHPAVGQLPGAVQRRVERRGRGPPSRGSCRPSPAAAATGRTTSARSVTALGNISRLTTKPAAASAASASAGSGRSARSTPPTSSAAELAVADRGEDAGRCRGPGRRHLGVQPQRQRPRHGPRRRRRCRPPGSRLGRAPASTAPRSPARRGTQATRAPVARASATSAEKAPGTPASRSPASTTAPGRRSASTAGRPSVPSVSARSDAPWPRAASRARSPSASRPPRGERREVDDRQLPVRTVAPEPQEDDRRLLLGLEAGEQDGGGRSRSLVGDRAATGAGAGDAARGTPAPRPEWARARASTSLVPSATRANLA